MDKQVNQICCRQCGEWVPTWGNGCRYCKSCSRLPKCVICECKATAGYACWECTQLLKRLTDVHRTTPVSSLHDPGREARIQAYQERAARGEPIFPTSRDNKIPA